MARTACRLAASAPKQATAAKTPNAIRTTTGLLSTRHLRRPRRQKSLNRSSFVADLRLLSEGPAGQQRCDDLQGAPAATASDRAGTCAAAALIFSSRTKSDQSVRRPVLLRPGSSHTQQHRQRGRPACHRATRSADQRVDPQPAREPQRLTRLRHYGSALTLFAQTFEICGLPISAVS